MSTRHPLIVRGVVAVFRALAGGFFRLDVRTAYLETANFRTASFDAVTMTDVLGRSRMLPSESMKMISGGGVSACAFEIKTPVERAIRLARARAEAAVVTPDRNSALAMRRSSPGPWGPRSA